MFLYYANEESDDVIGGSSKLVQHSITNISRSIKAVFFKLGTRNVHTLHSGTYPYTVAYIIMRSTPCPRWGHQ